MAKPQESVQTSVLESMFSTMEAAVANSVTMPFGKVGYTAAPLLPVQLPLQLGAWLCFCATLVGAVAPTFESMAEPIAPD